MESQETAYRLMHAFFQIHRQKMNSGQVRGRTHGELRVLRSIKRLDIGQGVMVSELSNLMKVSSPFITQTVNGLVKEGLVDRSADPSDRRAVRLRVTNAGEELVHEVFTHFIESHRGLVQYLGQEQSEQLIDLLHRVYQYFELESAGGKNCD